MAWSEAAREAALATRRANAKNKSPEQKKAQRSINKSSNSQVHSQALYRKDYVAWAAKDTARAQAMGIIKKK